MAESPAPASILEERLRSAQSRFALLADVLELQALGIERADQPVGPDASRALADTCRQAAGDLHALLAALPVEVLNWCETAAKQQPRRKSR